MAVRIGISGWTYPPWRGTFYPAGLPQRRELAYVGERLSSVEINGSFYALQRPTSYAAWAAAVPEDFRFAVKAPRFITHMKKLVDVETPLANFLASGLLGLGRRTGPVLWQLPATFVFEPGRIARFCALLPRTAGAAAAMATGYGAPLDADRALTVAPEPDLVLRHAIEVRHASFATREFHAILAEHDVALVVADNPGQGPVFLESAASFGYVRLHGDTELYASGYDDAALDRWAERIAGWAEGGRDVFVYCDNDAKVRAPYDAMGLQRRLDALR